MDTARRWLLPVVALLCLTAPCLLMLASCDVALLLDVADERFSPAAQGCGHGFWQTAAEGAEVTVYATLFNGRGVVFVRLRLYNELSDSLIYPVGQVSLRAPDGNSATCSQISYDSLGFFIGRKDEPIDTGFVVSVPPGEARSIVYQFNYIDSDLEIHPLDYRELYLDIGSIARHKGSVTVNIGSVKLVPKLRT